MEVSTAILFRENWRHGTNGRNEQTDRRTDMDATLNAAPWGGLRNKQVILSIILSITLWISSVELTSWNSEINRLLV